MFWGWAGGGSCVGSKTWAEVGVREGPARTSGEHTLPGSACGFESSRVLLTSCHT